MFLKKQSFLEEWTALEEIRSSREAGMNLYDPFVKRMAKMYKILFLIKRGGGH